MLHLLVCGSRNFYNYNFMCFVLNTIIDDEDDVEIVSGHCNGADKLAEKFAEENNIQTRLFIPDWKLGKAAGPIRNKEMIDYISQFDNKLVVAFVDRNSKGTRNTISLARDKNIKTYVYEFFDNNLSIELNEGISIDNNGNVVFDWNNDSIEDIIKLQTQEIKATKFHNNIRYFQYKVIENKENKNKVLNYIKRTKDNNVSEMIEKCVENFYEKSDIKHFDYILKIPSSSNINNEICNTIVDKYDNSEIIDINKKPSIELEFDYDLFQSKYNGKYFEEFKLYMNKMINELKKKDDFLMKRIPAKYRSYIKSMLSFDNNKIKNNSNILIVDDIFTTGSTIGMLLKLLEETNFEGNIYILNLINNR